MSDLDLGRFRRALEDSLRRFPEAEFLQDVRLLLDSYERSIEKRKIEAQYPMRELVRQTLRSASEDAREGDVIEGEVIERPSATFTALQLIRLYRMEHASRLRNPCTRGHGLCVACARADVLLAQK